MSSLKLTDDELDQVFRAAQPLAPADRDQFLKDVAMRLSALVRAVFFEPAWRRSGGSLTHPDLGGPGVLAKYR